MVLQQGLQGFTSSDSAIYTNFSSTASPLVAQRRPHEKRLTHLFVHAHCHVASSRRLGSCTYPSDPPKCIGCARAAKGMSCSGTFFFLCLTPDRLRRGKRAAFGRCEQPLHTESRPSSKEGTCSSSTSPTDSPSPTHDHHACLLEAWKCR